MTLPDLERRNDLTWSLSLWYSSSASCCVYWFFCSPCCLMRINEWANEYKCITDQKQISLVQRLAALLSEFELRRCCYWFIVLNFNTVIRRRYMEVDGAYWSTQQYFCGLYCVAPRWFEIKRVQKMHQDAPFPLTKTKQIWRDPSPCRSYPTRSTVPSFLKSWIS